jgi:hypothetical protein
VGLGSDHRHSDRRPTDRPQLSGGGSCHGVTARWPGRRDYQQPIRNGTVWDLTAGIAVGDPLSGHTNTVAAVATAMLPDGRVVAVTGGRGRTLWIWDLDLGRTFDTPCLSRRPWQGWP